MSDGHYIICSSEYMKELRLSLDPFGIYKSRRLLAKQFPSTLIYRGHEWWHGRHSRS